MRRRLSTAFHPQTDGQTERQNQVLEQYLRCFCAEKQADWAEWLPMAKFASNDSVSATLRISPFYALMGYSPQLHGNAKPRDDASQGEVPVAMERVRHMRATREELETQWRKASEQQTLFYNKTHKPKSFNPGDLVLLL
jgi:hypothetical protein